MVEISLESVVAQAERLSPLDRLRLLERIAASLQTVVTPDIDNWHQALRDSYGILKDEPIERPAQLPW